MTTVAFPIPLFDYKYLAMVMLNKLDYKTYTDNNERADLIIRNHIEKHLDGNKKFRVIVKPIMDMELHNITSNHINLITSNTPRTGVVITPGQNTVLYASRLPALGDSMYMGVYTAPSTITYLNNISDLNPRYFEPTVINLTRMFTAFVPKIPTSEIKKVIDTTITRIIEKPIPTSQPIYHKTCLLCSDHNNKQCIHKKLKEHNDAKRSVNIALMKLNEMHRDNMNECAKILAELSNNTTAPAKKRPRGRPCAKIAAKTAPLPIKKRPRGRPCAQPCAKKTIPVHEKQSQVTTRSMKKVQDAYSLFGVRSIGCS
jgi:hypothetical protein